MDRREFCSKIGSTAGSIALASILQACNRVANPAATAEPMPTHLPKPADQLVGVTPLPTNAPTATVRSESTDQPLPPTEPNVEALTDPTVAPYLATVAVVKTTDRASGIRSALSLLDLKGFGGRRVLVKPNFNSADPAPGSTHPDTLRTLVQAISELGAGEITIGDRSGMGTTRAVMEQIGVFGMATELGFNVAIFDELDAQAWTIVHPEGSHWSAGFPVPNLLLEAETIVQTCNLKTHQYGGHFTMSLKNSVGFVAKSIEAGGHNYMSELHSSPYQRQMIAEINSIYQPELVIMDGIEAFIEGGPAKGKVAQSEVILASRDRVAIDAVGVAILRMFGTTPEVTKGRVFEQAQLARAAALGLGAKSPSQIQFVTGDRASQAYANTIGDLLHS